MICFSPRHDLTLPEMPLADIRGVVDVWAEQMTELGQRYRWVQVFENKGAVMGCSNPHPHGQIWAGSALPHEPAKEDRQQRAYFAAARPAAAAGLRRRWSWQLPRAAAHRGRRTSTGWRSCPYWAVWPFETLLLPRRHVLRLPDLTRRRARRLAEHPQAPDRPATTTSSRPRSPTRMGWHGAPTEPMTGCQLSKVGNHQPTGSCTPTSTRRCCARPRVQASSWSATRCWASRSATSRPSRPRRRLREQSEVHYKDR
ncbi:MAG: galactose-1-phosphate uridylyltransferase [Microthrixaceae bacterium]